MSALLRTVRALGRIAWPVILAGLVTLFMSGNDAVLLAGSSDRVLASAIAAGSIQVLAVMIVTGLITASQVLVARAMGEGRRDRAARSAETGLWLGLWGGIASALVFALLTPLVLTLFDGPSIDRGFASGYLAVTLCALPFTGMAAALRSRLTGLGTTRGLFLASISAAAVDVGAAIALSWLMGPLGVAIATVAGTVVNAAVLAHFARRDAPGTGVRPPRAGAFVRLDRRELRAVLALGWPEAVLFGASSGAAVVVTWLLAPSPSAELAASRFLELATTSIAYIVLSGFGTAATTLLGKAAGGADAPAFVRTFRHTLAATGAVTVIVLAVGPLAYLPIVGLAATPAVVAASAPVLWLAFAQTPLMAVHVSVVAALRSLKDTRSPMIASIVSEYAVFLPLGWLLTRVIPLGLTGVFIDHLVFWIVSVVIVSVRLVPRMRALQRETTRG